MNLTGYSPYNQFSHQEWGRLRADTPLTLTEQDLVRLRGQNEQVALDEVAEIYLPLTRLLNLYVTKAQELYQDSAEFLRSPAARVPYIIGLAKDMPQCAEWWRRWWQRWCGWCGWR